jgi:hypothetical protein
MAAAAPTNPNKRPLTGGEEREAKKARLDAGSGEGGGNVAAYEAIFSHYLGDKKISPEAVKQEWEKAIQELAKMKQHVTELKLHESALVIRLSSKEQEIHSLQAELQDLRKNMTPSNTASRNALLDPTINALFQRMKDELDAVKERLKQSQEDLSAATFTRESAAGRQLLNRIRLLQKENEELGQQLSEGQTHKLELEISMQRELAEELKRTLDESNEFVMQLNEEMEKRFEAVSVLKKSN